MGFRLYLLQAAIAFDRQVNALLGGSADETLSSRAYRADHEGKWPGTWFRPLIDGIFKTIANQDDHCHKAWSYEEERLKANVEQDTAGQALTDSLRNS